MKPSQESIFYNSEHCKHKEQKEAEPFLKPGEHLFTFGYAQDTMVYSSLEHGEELVIL